MLILKEIPKDLRDIVEDRWIQKIQWHQSTMGIRRVNLKSVGNCFVFECEYYENNETATFCNVAANNNLKIQVDKSVGPNDTTKNVCAGFHWVASIQMISWLT